MSRDKKAAPKANAPWRCDIPDLTSMEFMDGVTALQLAQLAANLKTSGIIPSPREPQDYDNSAIAPLKITEREELEAKILQENERLEANRLEHDRLKKLLESQLARGEMVEMQDTELKLEELKLNLRGQTTKVIELEHKLGWQIEPHEDNETGVSNRELVLEAAEFLALCNEVKSVLREAQRWEDLKIKISKELEIIAQKLNFERIPVKELIRVAGADRLKLTSSELETLNVTKGWEEMTTEEQAVEIFMHLSSRKFQGAILIPERESGKFIPQRSYLLQLSLEDAALSEGSNRFNPEYAKARKEGVFSESCSEEGTSPALELPGDVEQNNSAKLQRNIADNEAARRKLCELGIPPFFDTLLNIVISLREAKVQRDSALKRSAAMKSRQGEGKKANGPKTVRTSDGTRRKQKRDNTSGRFKGDKTSSPLAEAVSLINHQKPRHDG